MAMSGHTETKDEGEGYISETFLCNDCGGKYFLKVYTFSIRFKEVDFSDEMIYDKMEDERYMCGACRTTYSQKEVDDTLRQAKRRIRSRQ